MLPPQVIDDYFAFYYGAADARNFLQKYPHDLLLLSPEDKAPLALLSTAPEWKRPYRDGSCILFVRADSEAAKIPAVEVSPHDTPASYFP